ncbi:MAG: Bug family tripartite tricarboxylate transporter substrate binding protein [Burkholderiales bacterium]
MRNRNRFAFLLILTITLALGATTGSAQSYPVKPVRISSVFPTGLTPDVVLRVVAERLSNVWGQPVLVEPRPGANGFPAFEALKRAAPDGHELLLITGSQLTLNPHILKSVPYDPINDFSPVSMIYRTGFLMVVANNGPYQKVQDIVAAARANPGKINYSSPFVGSPPHIGGALLGQLTNTTMVPVHYKEAAQLFISVANGDTAFVMAGSGSASPLVRAGRLKFLAVVGPARLESDPEVPTMKEAGGPEALDVDSWGGIMAPRATSPDLVRRISADIVRVMAEAGVQERYRKVGFEPRASTPAEMANLIKAEYRRFGELAKQLNISPD